MKGFDNYLIISDGKNTARQIRSSRQLGVSGIWINYGEVLRNQMGATFMNAPIYFLNVGAAFIQLVPAIKVFENVDTR